MTTSLLRQLPFPAINASLNGTSAALLLAGYVLIKQRRIRAHAVAMIAAVCTSTLFLACYLTYHSLNDFQSKKLEVQTPWFRTLYFAILISHTLLAVVILPLIALTLWRAYRRRWDLHRKISVITFPLWLYVSVTGVVIYFLLYHIAPKMR